jgi:hypothetical protein
MMLHFRRALNHLEVKEIQLVGRKYNWSNARQLPTMSRIDRAFCIIAWKSHFINPIIQPLSSAVSNQCPLLLVPLIPPKFNPIFQFKSFWTEMVGFKDCVKEAWDREISGSHNPFATLRIKLSRTAKALKFWAKSIVSQAKLAMIIAREVIAQMDRAQEYRNLTEGERVLIKTLKVRLLGLATIEKSRSRQKFQLTWLKKVMQTQNFPTS